MSISKIVTMYCQEGGSDKEYRLELIPDDKGWSVTGYSGRRGGVLKPQQKCSGVDYETGLKEYNAIFKEKVNKKRYVPQAEQIGDSIASAPYIASPLQREDTGLAPQLLNMIRTPEELEVYLKDPNFIIQKKHDGERRSVSVDSKMDMKVGNKEGMATSLPENTAQDVKKLANLVGGIDVDGELVGDHFIIFELLKVGDVDLRQQPYEGRLAQLVQLMSKVESQVANIHLIESSGQDYKSKKALVGRLEKENAEGFTLKDVRAAHAPGRPSKGGSQMKYKFYEDCSLRVSSISVAKRSVHVEGLDENGSPVDLGKITIPVNYDIPKKGDIVNIRYLYCYRGGKLFQTTYSGKRDDQTLPDSLDKLKFKQEVSYDKKPSTKAPKLKM